ncbi:MAG: DUF1501 domain-containing protein [Chitinophagales bacterium]|nr:DUF1501 domain-containing protein [Chitinophagales bacterium]OJV30784.1 MAG: hypothetical protein BGO32_09825 [Bacteroidetes bacterium 37-13]HRP39117.1 DUF1501 domain-containing protein [Chitinophagales bacterium]
MKRREFIRRAVPAVTVPMMLNGLNIKAFGESAQLESLTGARGNNDHVLVLIELSGGNDGLNTVIPIDQYSGIAAVRSNVMIDQSKVLALNGTSSVGLHPSMSGVQQMYNNGKVKIVQSVGYPNPNFSHFRSTDIWTSASDSNTYLTSGWMGRYLNFEYPNYPTDYPNTTMPDPLAIQIGGVSDPVFMGPVMNMAYSLLLDSNNEVQSYTFLGNIQDPYSVQNPYKKELDYLRAVKKNTNGFGTAVKNAYDATATQSAYPNTDLAKQLKIVAKLISGGLKTKVYWVSIGGFDTHASQVETDTTKGKHADLLQTLSDAVKAFHDDLQQLGLGDRVISMTYSEFGRRIISNFSSGTDHGAAAPLLLFGNKVVSGILGSNPIVSSSATVNDNLPMQYDFRSVYASVLQDWLCVSQQDVESTILLQNFQSLPLVQNSDCIASGIREQNQAAGLNLIRAYPNPFTTRTTIEFTTAGSHTLVEIFNPFGQQIKTLVDADFAQGTYQVDFENEGYAAGMYYVRFQNGAVQQVKPLVIAQ